MTPQAQEAIVDIFRAMEKILGGKAPSNGLVFRTVRELGFRFTDTEGKELLSKFRQPRRPRGAPGALPARPASAPGITHERTSAAPEPPLDRTSSARATRAGDKELPSSQSLSHEESPPSPSAPSGTATPRSPRLPLEREDDLAAYRILDAVWEVLKPYVAGKITRLGWRQRNKRIAMDLARAGATADAVKAAHAALCDRRRTIVFRLDWVQEAMLSTDIASSAPLPPRSRVSTPAVIR